MGLSIHSSRDMVQSGYFSNLGLCVWMGGVAEQLCWLSLRTEGGMEVMEKLGYSCALHRVTPRLSLRAIRCVIAIKLSDLLQLAPPYR